MADRDAKRSFEEILTAVEQDEGLRGEGEARTVADEVSREGELGRLGSLLSPELLLRLPGLLKAVETVTAPIPGSDVRPVTPIELLCALRPYMNERRRRALDAMIRISRLSDSLGSLH